MLLKNTFDVPHPVDAVWEFFEDIPQVAACLPGAELTEVIDDDDYRGRVAVGLGPVKLRFNGIAGLESSLLKRPELFVGTLSEKLLTFALGRGIETSDAPAIRAIVRKGQTADYRFAALIEAIVTSTPFQMRNSP